MTNLNETLSKFGVKLAYGEKVELGDATIVPVAIASFGFGYGEGPDGKDLESSESAGDRAQSGSGAGGGGFSWPIGSYVSDEFGTRFQPNVIALLVVSIPLACITGWALPRIIKALKK